MVGVHRGPGSPEAHAQLRHAHVGAVLLLSAWGLGFGVWGLGFGVWGLGFGVWGLGFGVEGVGFGFRVLGVRVYVRFRVLGLEGGEICWELLGSRRRLRVEGPVEELLRS